MNQKTTLDAGHTDTTTDEVNLAKFYPLDFQICAYATSVFFAFPLLLLLLL